MAEFKDLLLKIANNARLTPQELDDLGRFGTETQQRNSLVAGWVNPTTNSEPIHLDRNIGIHIKRVADQSFTNNTPTLVVWDTTVWQQSYKYYDSAISTTKITIPVTGFYQMIGMAEWDANGTGTRYMELLKNGAYRPFCRSYVSAITGGLTSHIITLQEYHNVGDYLEFSNYQSSGGTLAGRCSFILTQNAGI